mgnify:CR=1 FL=1
MRNNAPNPQNARVGRAYPAPVRNGASLHPGRLRYHWKYTPNGPVVTDCLEGEACDPRGHGSKEWCGKCGKVSAPSNNQINE